MTRAEFCKDAIDILIARCGDRHVADGFMFSIRTHLGAAYEMWRIAKAPADPAAEYAAACAASLRLAGWPVGGPTT